MKKLLSVILSVVMAMSAFSVAFAAESDGVPTVFDVSEDNYYQITEENYDPDGIVFTGNNPDTLISIETNVDIIFRDLLFGWMDVGSAESVDITLEGDNTINSTAGVGISTVGADKDGNVYNITVKEGIISINVEFVLNAQGALEITAVTPAGNDSPIAPPLGETVPYAIAIVVAISCVAVLALSKKAFVR